MKMIVDILLFGI